MIHNGLSGCELKILGDGILRKYSSSIGYNKRLLKQIDKQILFSKFILKNINTPKVLKISLDEVLFFLKNPKITPSKIDIESIRLNIM